MRRALAEPRSDADSGGDVIWRGMLNTSRKRVVGINLLKPFPRKCFAISFIEFEVVLGIE